MSKPPPGGPADGLINDENGHPCGWPSGGVYRGCRGGRSGPTKIRAPRLPMPMTAAAPPSTPDTDPVRYEDALAELERLVQAMEGGQMPLDGLLDAYKRGARLLAF